MNNIKVWSPLIKEGGLLTGHDYNKTHPSIVKAVTDCFGEIIRTPRSCMD